MNSWTDEQPDREPPPCPPGPVCCFSVRAWAEKYAPRGDWPEPDTTTD